MYSSFCSVQNIDPLVNTQYLVSHGGLKFQSMTQSMANIISCNNYLTGFDTGECILVVHGLVILCQIQYK